jgi:uncharacterized protein (TIGR03437 family)
VLATSSSLNYPKSVSVGAAGDIYIADSFNSRIRQVTENGRIWTIAGRGTFGDTTPEGGDAANAEFRFPAAVLAGPNGTVYVGDTDNSRIKLLTPLPAAPAIFPGGVISLSGFGGSARAAQGSRVEIYGDHLAAGTRVWAAEDFVGDRAPTALGGTTVTVGGQAAFVSYVSPGQVNALIPDTVPMGPQTLVVTTAVGVSAPAVLNVRRTEPGILAPAHFKKDGTQYAAAFSADASEFIMPQGAVEGVTSHPARPGDTIVLYGIGFGNVAPGVATGEVPRDAARTVLPVEVFIGGQRAAVEYSGVAPGSLGLYQLNVVVPVVSAGDAVPITIKLGQEEATQALFTSVAN